MVCVAARKPRARNRDDGDAGPSARSGDAAIGFLAATRRAAISRAWASLAAARDALASRRAGCLALLFTLKK